MTLWIIFLRAVGTLVLIVGVIGGTARLAVMSPVIYSFIDTLPFVYVIVENLALVVLCFGAASGLGALRRIDQRIARSASARRRARQESQPAKDLAPVAPDWDEIKPGLHPALIERRLQRSHRLGTDNIPDMFEQAVLIRRKRNRDKD